jgi:hypothetical protein
LVLGDAQLHLLMAHALNELWPTEAALTEEPWYR